MREWEIGAVENIHGALPYIRFAPILDLVGVGVNRIGKVRSRAVELNRTGDPMSALYHYAILEKPEAPLEAAALQGIDMENLDYKRQPDVARAAGAVAASGGMLCGIWRGGMFGLATNRIAILSAWQDVGGASAAFADLGAGSDDLVLQQQTFKATVRPARPERITRDGFYVIRWIRMMSRDIEEYTQLCLETWPAFEAAGTARCHGVFRPLEESEVAKILMLTWYASMNDWEKTRALAPADNAKWARRSEMELSHWADAGRLAVV